MKRKSERRAAYNMTLPVTLMSNLDATLGKKQTRSGVIEHLIRNHLAIIPHETLYKYQCRCGHAITTPTRRIRVCKKCMMHEMDFAGVFIDD